MSKQLMFYLFSFFFFLLSSSWSQTMWTKYPGNPVLSGGATGTWNHHVFGPEVIFNVDSSRYEMWYTASFGPPNWRPYQIGYAKSMDGINWTMTIDTSVLKVDPGSWEASTVEYPSILRENGQYKMWYTGWSPTVVYSIGYATSSDGIKWTKHNGNPIMGPGTEPWEAGGNGYCDVLHIGGEYKMWYTGIDVAGTHAQIGYATSLDGITWTRHSQNPVLTIGSPGEWNDEHISTSDVVYLDGTYYLWYDGNQTGSSLRRVGLATSPDGINWTIYDDPTTTDPPFAESDPILIPSPGGQWDRSYVGNPSIIPAGNSWHMWYEGSREPTGTYLWRIGYATAPVTIIVPTDVPTIQAGIDSASDGNIVLVEEGTYFENINFRGKKITVASRFILDEDTTHITNTTINGYAGISPDSGSVVYFISGEDTNSVLKGFTITGGTGTKYTYASTNQHTGGGLFIWSGGKIENNKIIYNHLTNAGNRYTHGAGMDLGPEGRAVVRNNIIAHNTIDAWWGAGAGVVMGCGNAASILFDKNILADNIYNADGGLCAGGAAIFASSGWEGRIIFSNNKILRNQAISTVPNNGLAGGIYIESASPEIYNNIISENTTSGRGGGILVGTDAAGSPGNPIIINNTIAKNKARYGGGLYNESTTNNPFIMNTIFWGDSATVSGNEIYRASGQVTIVYSDVDGGYTGTGNVSKDPMLRGENFILSDSSSCIGAGIDQYIFGSTTYYCPPVCFMGNSRPNPSGSNPDMGACESPLDSPLVGLRPQVVNNQPNSYDLKQNYPNPFNPRTTIEFDLPKAGKVTLKVFNVLGEEVATLVSDRLAAGSYSYEWSRTAGIASGVYLYRLEAGNYVETRKMILMK